jgi:hypothetical protein
VDNVQKAIVQQSDVEKSLSKTASSFNLRWPLNDRNIRSLKSLTDHETLAELKDLNAQGATAESFKNDLLSNEWLHSDSLLGSWVFSNAIRLSIDTMGTRVARARENPDMDKRCRHYWTKNESLGHILGECTAGKGLRINRHNEIVELLEKEASSKGFACAKEQTYTTAESQLLKPDLVLNNGARTLVVDVTVRYEREDWLVRARSEKKKEIYEP